MPDECAGNTDNSQLYYHGNEENLATVYLPVYLDALGFCGGSVKLCLMLE